MYKFILILVGLYLDGFVYMMPPMNHTKGRSFAAGNS